MKKLLKLAVFSLMVGFLFSCGASTENSDQANEEPNATEATVAENPLNDVY